MAKLAAERRTDEDLIKMKASLDKRSEADYKNDLRAYVDNDLEFHLAIAVASKNSVLMDLYHSFSDVLRDALDKLAADEELHQNLIEIHKQLFNAIAKKDIKAAEYWSAENIDRIMKSLQGLLR